MTNSGPSLDRISNCCFSTSSLHLTSMASSFSFNQDFTNTICLQNDKRLDLNANPFILLIVKMGLFTYATLSFHTHSGKHMSSVRVVGFCEAAELMVATSAAPASKSTALVSASCGVVSCCAGFCCSVRFSNISSANIFINNFAIDILKTGVYAPPELLHCRRRCCSGCRRTTALKKKTQFVWENLIDFFAAFIDFVN